MKRLPLLLIALALFAGCAGTSRVERPVPRIQKAYLLVDGTVEAKDEGTIVHVRPYDERGELEADTLALYLQHREALDTPLNAELLKKADLSYYCFPEAMKRADYALPEAGGVVYSHYLEGERTLILFDDSQFH